jgi:hypothetical protein
MSFVVAATSLLAVVLVIVLAREVRLRRSGRWASRWAACCRCSTISGTAIEPLLSRAALLSPSADFCG